MGISLSDLASIRTMVNGFLPETNCTISPGNVTTTCRIDDSGREAHLDQLPRILRLRRWYIQMPDGLTIAPGAQITVPGKATYLVTVVIAPQSNSVSTDVVAIQLPTPVVASTKRGPTAALAPGQQGGFSTHLASLTCYPFGGIALQPVTPKFMADTFGVSLQQPAVIFAAPPVSSELYPIRPADQLIHPLGSFEVVGVQNYAPLLTLIYVDVPTS